jgi:hypothetical protein
VSNVELRGRSVALRLLMAMLALAAGVVALVVAVLYIRSVA